jgi:hypothetical protein
MRPGLLSSPLALAGLAAAGLLGLLSIAAGVFELEWTSRAWDAHVLLQTVTRANELGLPYHTAGIDQKGPLWILPYDIAYKLGGPYNLWWFVGAFVIAVALATAAAIWRIGAAAGPARLPALAVAVLAAVWLYQGPEEYGWTLYSRNLIALAFAASLALLLAAIAGRRTTAWVALSGVLAGLAVQTNPSSAVTGLAWIGLVAWLTWRGPLRDGPRFGPLPRLFAVAVAAAAVAFFSVFVWYAIRGALDDFWWAWWDYNRVYTESTGLGPLEIAERGLGDFAQYYREHPVLLATLAVFAIQAFLRARAGESRWLDVTLLGWWLSECVVVALAQRFFPHYPVLTFVPVAAMAAVMAARWGTLLPAGLQVAAPALAIAWAVLVPGWARFHNGFELLKDFKSPTATVVAHVGALEPLHREIRDVVRSNSPDGSYIYIWTNIPWDYTDYERRAATRFTAKHWLTGEVFGAPSDPDNVLPGTWERWREDIRRTPPVLIIQYSADPIPQGTPAARLVECAYEPLVETPAYVISRRVKPVDGCV